MNQWDIVLSRESLKFLDKNHLTKDSVVAAITLAIRKLSGEDTSVDLKKLKPPYEGYFRIRVGKMRITCCFDFDSRVVEVAEIEWRGSAYKK